jgi:hypothetical protein
VIISVKRIKNITAKTVKQTAEATVDYFSNKAVAMFSAQPNFAYAA